MPKTALLFPGQGAQAVGMGETLVARSPEAAELFGRAEQILGYDLLQICREGPESKLSATEYSQPALFVHSLAALADLRRQRPDLDEQVVAVAGLSLGEYTALVAAGGLDFEAGLRLVQLRGRAMQQAADLVPSGMASVLGLEADQVDRLCQAACRPEEILQPANFLCPGNIAISGHIGSIEQAEGQAEAAGAMRCVRLSVAGAFHTPLMQPACAQLEAALAEAPWQSLTWPVYSNVDAQPHSDCGSLAELLSKQVVSPVQWQRSLERLLADGIEHFIEIGIGRVLVGTLKRTQRRASSENWGD